MPPPRRDLTSPSRSSCRQPRRDLATISPRSRHGRATVSPLRLLSKLLPPPYLFPFHPRPLLLLIAVSSQALLLTAWGGGAPLSGITDVARSAQAKIVISHNAHAARAALAGAGLCTPAALSQKGGGGEAGEGEGEGEEDEGRRGRQRLNVRRDVVAPLEALLEQVAISPDPARSRPISPTSQPDLV